MVREAVNPKELYDSIPFGFSHAIRSAGETHLHCAGQVAWDADCNLVGEGDLEAQARQAFDNLRTVLASQGATPENVVRIRTYVVDYSVEKLEAIGPIIGGFFDEAVPAANTLIGVQALAMPGFLIEVEATAVLD